jgi:hypothetical protein
MRKQGVVAGLVMMRRRSEAKEAREGGSTDSPLAKERTSKTERQVRCKPRLYDLRSGLSVVEIEGREGATDGKLPRARPEQQVTSLETESREAEQRTLGDGGG